MPLSLLLLAVSSFTLWKVVKMADNVADLEAEIANLSSAVDGAVVLIDGIADRVAEAIRLDDAAEEGHLGSLVADLRANTGRLSAAVVANTPQAPDEPEVPTEPEAPVEPEAPAEPTEPEATGDEPTNG